MSNYKNGGWDNKFIITKRSGKPIDSDAVYFVLRLDKDPNAIVAMEAYANSVEKINPKLARDIRNRLGACKRMAEIVQDQALSELEAESESRTDRLLDELADNMAKADEAMKPDKPLEQSEFTKIIRPRIDDDNFSQADMEDACDIIDRQAAEIKRLKEQNEILKNKYQVLVYVLCSDIDVACQEARPCTVDNLRDYIGFALDIARQYGLSETIKDKKQALNERK